MNNVCIFSRDQLTLDMLDELTKPKIDISDHSNLCLNECDIICILRRWEGEMGSSHHITHPERLGEGFLW